MAIDRQSLLKNFAEPDERLLFSKVLDQAFLCAKKQQKCFSDFLDPIKQSKFVTILRNERQLDLHIEIFGGFVGAERNMIGFAPDFSELAHESYPISLLDIKYNRKYYKELTHRDFLGAIIGLGIERTKIGDILIGEDSANLFIHNDMAGFVEDSLINVGRATVSVARLSQKDLNLDESKKEEARFTVSSLRLDTIISGVFHMSRGKAAALIQGEKVFVNYSLVSNLSKQIAEGDMITLRGFGKMKIVELLGKTKKDKFAITVLIY